MVVGSPTVLNLVPSGAMPVVYINETDEGFEKEFLIYNGHAAFSVPVNVSATIRGTKGDRRGVAENATVTAGTNRVSVTITEQMTAVAGPNIYELVFVDTSGLRVGTINFIMLVEKSALSSDTIISDSDIAYAEQVIDELGSIAAYGAVLNNKPYKFDTVAMMKADTSLENGMYAITGGYYAVNDGGCALYRIYSTAPATYYETLTSGLYAELITNGKSSVKMYGAHGDGTSDDTASIETALNQDDIIFFPIGDYRVSRPIEVNKDRVTIKGQKILTKTGASVEGYSRIIASEGFSGNYVLKFNGTAYDGQILNESIQIKNISIDCNGVTGGVYAPVLYDNCRFECFSILNVGFDFCGFDSPTLSDSLIQSVDLEEVWITGALGTSAQSSSVPLMRIERWQECVLTNVKVGGTNVDCIDMKGCIGILFSMCSTLQRYRPTPDTIATGGTGTGYKIRPFVKNGVGVQAPNHITFQNCLNEGCAVPVDIYAKCQVLSGTFNSGITRGSTVTQGTAKGYIISASTSALYVYVDESYDTFGSGSCNVGAITSVNNAYHPCSGIKAYNLRTIGINSAEYNTIGIGDSFFDIDKGNSDSVVLNAYDNECVDFIYPYSAIQPFQFDFETGVMDESTNIQADVPYCMSATAGVTLSLPPANRGLKVRIKNDTGVGINVSKWSADTIEGMNTVTCYGSEFVFECHKKGKWAIVKGVMNVPITVNSGGTISNNSSVMNGNVVTLSFMLTASAGSFGLAVPFVPKDTTYFTAYNNTKGNAFMCYVRDNGVIAPYPGETAHMESGDLIICKAVYIAVK